ncbi:hypothetical protein DM01DRAFT_253068 [Hesseltinella vesiculosa]|uniref:Ubiquitin-like domain-containing protein n=1 Tax=Hesseltinella vesiculosa TaxID=101127 RepID=A0A1X2GRE5_9FUNG|nr:hypothetical protein DM01DRAFT_253068 [Hesseltinella vesiculosa]
MDPPNEQLLVHIRFTDAQDLSLYVFPLYDTPSSVKAMIQNEFPSTRSKNIRLIFNGQVLTSNTTILWDYGIRSSNLYMHCAISDFVKHDTTKPMRSKVTCVARGFDRLVATGFNQEEIRSIRSQFHQLQGRPFSEDQDPSDQLLQYEEQWMNQTGESVPEGSKWGYFML